MPVHGQYGGLTWDLFGLGVLNSFGVKDGIMYCRTPWVGRARHVVEKSAHAAYVPIHPWIAKRISYAGISKCYPTMHPKSSPSLPHHSVLVFFPKPVVARTLRLLHFSLCSTSSPRIFASFLPSEAGECKMSVEVKEKPAKAETGNYKGFVGGVFSGIAKLSGK